MPHRTAEIIWLDKRRRIPSNRIADDLAEHPLGRFYLVGAITRAQYKAGESFALDVSLYRRAIAAKKELQSVAGFGQPSPSTSQREMIFQAYRDKYMRAFEAIGSRQSQCAIKHVVVQELDLDSTLFGHLELGLSNLMAHYGLTDA